MDCAWELVEERLLSPSSWPQLSVVELPHAELGRGVGDRVVVAQVPQTLILLTET